MKLRSNPYHCLLTASFAITLGQVAMAADVLWSGATTGTLDWNTGSNWTGGAFVNSTSDRADLRADWTSSPVISLSAPTIANGILFDDTGVASDTGLTIGNGGNTTNTLTLGGTSPSIDVLSLSLTVSANLVGSSGFTKSNSGVLILNAANAGFSGPIVVSGGTLRLTNNSALNVGSVVQLNSGSTFGLVNSNTIAGLNDNSGTGGSVINTSGSGKVLTIGGTGNYSFSGNITGDSTSPTTLANTRVGLVVTSTGTQTLGGSNLTTTGYQSVTASGGTLVFAKQNSIFQGLAGAVVNTNQSTNAGINVSSGGTVALGVGDSASGYFDATAIGTFLGGSRMGASTSSAGFRQNSIFGFDTTNATAGTFTYSTALAQIGASTGLGFAKLGAGTLILDAANTYTGGTQVRAGTLQLGAGSTTGSIGSTADITVSSGATLAFNRSDATLSQSNKITGAGSVSQNGAGTTTLTSTTSDYSGGTNINGGTLTARIGSIGSGNVNLNSSAKQFKLSGADGSISNNITIASGVVGVSGQGLIDTDTGNDAVLNGTITINGAPTDTGAGHFGSSSGGSLTVNGVITSSVAVEWRRNNGVFSNGGTGYTNFRIRAGNVKLGGANGLATTATVALGGDAAATLDLAGFNQSLVGMTKGVGAATITNSGTSDSLLTTSGTSSYAGVIQDGGTNKVALTVNGGQLTLSGTNTYTGATNVTAGTLRINGNQSTAIGTVGIAASATLGGNGTVGGATTFAGASTHAPGSAAATVDTQTFSSTLNYATGSIFVWDLSATNLTDPGLENLGGATYDKVVAGGAITGSGVVDKAVFKIVLGSNSFTDAFWDTNKSWSDIFTGGSGSATNLAALFSGFDASGGVGATGIVTGRGQFTFNGSSTTLNWTAVPEPTSALAGLLITAGLLRRRRA